MKAKDVVLSIIKYLALAVFIAFASFAAFIGLLMLEDKLEEAALD